jgi:hypothetical protein
MSERDYIDYIQDISDSIDDISSFVEGSQLKISGWTRRQAMRS